MDEDTRFRISHVPDGDYSEKYVSHIADTDVTTEHDRMRGGILSDDQEKRLIRQEQQLCSHGSWFAPEELTLREAASEFGFEKTGFTGDAPDQICSYCWSEARERIERAESTREDDRDYTEVGFRLRWKQKGRAREEWYDVLVHPETTFNELDELVARQFSTVHGMHLRMYGFEGEYMDSTLQVMPDHQLDRVGRTSGGEQRASNVTISDVAGERQLRDGDRLSMVCDFGTPSRYYCIVKEVIVEDELETRFSEASFLYETDTAGIVKQRRPGSDTVDTGSNSGNSNTSSEDTGDDKRKSDDEEDVDVREELEDEFSDLISE